MCGIEIIICDETYELSGPVYAQLSCVCVLTLREPFYLWYKFMWNLHHFFHLMHDAVSCVTKHLWIRTHFANTQPLRLVWTANECRCVCLCAQNIYILSFWYFITCLYYIFMDIKWIFYLCVCIASFVWMLSVFLCARRSISLANGVRKTVSDQHPDGNRKQTHNLRMNHINIIWIFNKITHQPAPCEPFHI